MLIYPALFLLLLILLYFFSRTFSNKLYLFFYLLTKDRNTSIELLSWFFLPGTIVHELSHLFTAEILRVKTGKITFQPEIRENNEVRVGGLNIAKADPFRHSLVGLAPILTGIPLISIISHFYLYPAITKALSLDFKILNYQLVITNYFLIFALCYLIFILTNTMFSSREDLKTIFVPVLALVLLTLAFYFTGVRISLAAKTINLLDTSFRNLDLVLLGTVLIDLIFLGIINLLLRTKS